MRLRGGRLIRDENVKTLCRIPRHPRSGEVNLANAVGMVCRASRNYWRQGVSFNDFCAGLQVVVVYPADQFRLRDVQFVVALIDEIPSSKAMSPSRRHRGRATYSAVDKISCHLFENTSFLRELSRCGSGVTKPH